MKNADGFIAVGIGAGVAIGVATHNIAMGLALGVVFGIALRGIALRKKNDQ